MKSSTRLSSAVFHLTPTRTRCDLKISANGKTEKIASGLLNPFLAHLKTAQDQIDKGGYSIILEVEPGNDATWFTKGTVERFVRFVSTPEVLERVCTIETEIDQIEEAIAIEGNTELGLNSVEARRVKPAEIFESSKPITETNEEKAIVLYKPGTDMPEANGSVGREENSKVQLLRVLETRKAMLQKEQGMAFARAVAAGFDIEHMEPLVSFSETFGALRLMDACLRFNDLWKRKHETGQWPELEATEATYNGSAFSSMNASDIILSNGTSKETDYREEGVNGSGDQKRPMDNQVPIGHLEYSQGHFPHHIYPPWPIHPQPGAVPVFPPYPMQGMPYYQNFPGNNPYFLPQHASTEESRSIAGKKESHKRHSMDKNIESDNCDMDDSEVVKESPCSRESQKKTTRSGKKSGMVVIRNINFINSKRRNSSDSESQSVADSDTDEDTAELHADAPGIKQSKKKIVKHTKNVDLLDNVNGRFDEKVEDGGHWQAFQNCLLRGADVDKLAVDKGMFAMENDVKVKRRQNRTGQEPELFGGRNSGETGEHITEFHKFNGDLTRKPKGSNDDFMIHGRGKQTDSARSLLDPLAVNGYEQNTNTLGKNTSSNLTDESFVIPLRSNLRNQDCTYDRKALHMDSDLPSKLVKVNDVKTLAQVNFEPDDLMLERGIEKGFVGYDPLLDYEMQAQANNATSVNDRNNLVITEVKKGLKKLDKDQKTKVPGDKLEKKKMSGNRQGKPSKSSPLEEARARAERLRSFKADLQKVKKEKEEEQIKRLDALKMERQKRITARNASIPTPSPLPSQPTKRQLPTKLVPNSHRVSKLGDSEPGSRLPFQGVTIRKASLGSGDLTQKLSKPRSNGGSNSVGNRLSRSVSSLPESKKEKNVVKPDSKTSMAKIRRLSEPRMNSNNRHASPVKLRNIEAASKLKIVDREPESKKISAIINLDRTKAATLPELKIRTPKGNLNLVQSKLAAKETVSNVAGNHNPLVEKNVVINASGVDNHKREESAEIVSEYAAHAPALPLTINAVDREPTAYHLQDQHVVKATSLSGDNDSLKFSSTGIDEKSYKAPNARVSSLEDPSTGNFEFGMVPPATLEMETTRTVTARAYVTDNNKNLKPEKNSETLEKSHAKDTSKGIRRLLKFGRKNHGSGEHTSERDNLSFSGSSVDEDAASSASGEVHTLKNLISRDETPTAYSTPQKVSRHFSLLSPFRSKSGEKKVAS